MRPERASAASEPSDGMGIDTPSPRKERKLSVKMAVGICIAATMIITDTALGIMCLRMMRAGEAPMERDASTYSCSLMERIWPRTCRAMLTQYSRPNTMNMLTMPAPSFVMSALREPLTQSLIATDNRITISTSGKA